MAWTTEPSQVLVSSGAKQSLFNLCMALLSRGDEAISAGTLLGVLSRYGASGGMPRPVIVESGIDDDFKITPAQLGAAITDRTRLLFLNSPSNPNGRQLLEGRVTGARRGAERSPERRYRR